MKKNEVTYEEFKEVLDKVQIDEETKLKEITIEESITIKPGKDRALKIRNGRITAKGSITIKA